MEILIQSASSFLTECAPLISPKQKLTSRTTHALMDNQASQASDDEPMVYTTPRDYATWARNERERLIQDGADPASVILSSEVRNHVPRREGESPADYTKRYVDVMNGMLTRGVKILNDQTTADQVPDQFRCSGGTFDLGPSSGATKREYREFTQWLDKARKEDTFPEVPEQWKKFQKPTEL